MSCVCARDIRADLVCQATDLQPQGVKDFYWCDKRMHASTDTQTRRQSHATTNPHIYIATPPLLHTWNETSVLLVAKVGTICACQLCMLSLFLSSLVMFRTFLLVGCDVIQQVKVVVFHLIFHVVSLLGKHTPSVISLLGRPPSSLDAERSIC